jgi:AMP nucleosidase
METSALSPEQAVDRATELYEASVARLRKALADFVGKGKPPSQTARARGDFAYPELRLIYKPNGPPPSISRSFAKLSEPGVYVTTLTQPRFYRGYLLDQLTRLASDYPVTFEVAPSKSEIPYPYVLETAAGIDAEELPPAEFARWFPTPQLPVIGDEVVDGEAWDNEGVKPLALFDASTSRCSACATIPERRSIMCSATSCSPTTIAMSTISSTGRATA